MRMTARLRAALFSCLTTITLAAWAGGALAQPSPDQQSAIRASCRSDFMSKCPGVPRGGREALECLQKNVASLSPACKTAVSATIPAPAPAQAVPAPKAVAAPPPPPAAPTGPAPTATPPRAVISAPPPPAASARPPAPKPQQTAKPAPAPSAPAPAAQPPPEPVIPLAKIEALPVPVRLAVIRSCRQDQDAVCSSVRAGGGRLIACLAANSGALSPPCKAALNKALR